MRTLPVMPVQCKTCPFREDTTEDWKELRPMLQERALNEASPICHSTGKALTKRLGKAHICRGARNFQIEYFFGIGFIEAPTDEAWAKKLAEVRKRLA